MFGKKKVVKKVANFQRQCSCFIISETTHSLECIRVDAEFEVTLHQFLHREHFPKTGWRQINELLTSKAYNSD